MNNDPEIIDSPLSQNVEENGATVKIAIYRMADTKWSLEIVDEDWNSTVWDAPFETDEEALAVALKAINDEGIGSFIGKHEKRTLH